MISGQPAEARVPSGDLDGILERAESDFRALRHARLFITGGTGFVGTWLLESLAHADRRLSLGVRAVVATRDPERFARMQPRLATDAIFEFERADVREPLNVKGTFDAVIHAATPASAAFNAGSPGAMFDTVVEGTRHALELAARSGPIPFLLTSSGAVYGAQPPDVDLVDESFRGAPDPLDPGNAYHEGKRAAELLAAIASRETGVRAKIARLFAFVGPHLPLGGHFAIGNFIGDALAGRPIEILGDGTPRRTYLYAADMTAWLWRVLVRGEAGTAYNVGSERVVSIEETARLVAAAVEPTPPVVVRKQPAPGIAASRYACSTMRVRTTLGLAEWTPLETAIARTIAWHRAARSGTLRA